MAQQVLSVTQLNEYIRTRMDADPVLSGVAIRGEISNYKVYPSGHHYFTLKDDGGALKCVMFKGNAMRLRFRPDNGMKIIALGKISVYPRDGAYQLYCTMLVQEGVGDLHAAFEELKAKLSAKGLFDASHKKAIPQFPETIGIVTSPAGAAIHDMLRIIRRRYPLCKVRIFPTRVQGTEAPDEIVAAIRYANRYKLADLLIIGRGGGSIEDLWAFNDERVAYAIYDSVIPIISAVGHEPDVTIADYVADLRAATPSNGAELAVPDREALMQSLDDATERMTSALCRQIESNRKHLLRLSESPFFVKPSVYLERKYEQLEALRNRLTTAQIRLVERDKQRYVASAAKLDAMSPLKVLSRGYAMVQTENGEILRSVKDVTSGTEISVQLGDGQLHAAVLDIKEEQR